MEERKRCVSIIRELIEDDDALDGLGVIEVLETLISRIEDPERNVRP